MNRDLDLLQGSWSVTELEIDGQRTPASMLGEARIAIEGDRFTSSGMGAVYEGTITINADVTPRHLDMRFDTGPEKGNTNPGIYEISGDRWKICIATRGSMRPSSFVSPPGSGIAVETLVRGGDPATRKARPGKSKETDPKASSVSASAAPATELEGEWRMIAGVFNGVPMEASMVKWVKRMTHGDLTTVYAGPQLMLKAEFSVDPSQSPKHIGYLNLAGANKGKTQLGIYEIEGGVLRILVAEPGAPRPTEFRAVKGDGSTLTEWTRA